ncbi:MAG: response regulator [Micavibrio aeruginosavorus]|uniref:Response regulator n=1 Tax=Micavibrio aeruginosavorus TaxID=349221 RepID=A0A7T5R193_9BACT|nr:MAG: response regulator [Micavibrio aeruginosavorus]
MKQIQRILCVDDEPDMRLLIKLALENVRKYEVGVYGSGKELLDNISSHNPDIVLLDFVMPGMDGLQILHELRARDDCKGIPVIFMTGSSSESDIDMIMAAGAAGIISKPFDPLILAASIEEIWGRIHG